MDKILKTLSESYNKEKNMNEVNKKIDGINDYFDQISLRLSGLQIGVLSRKDREEIQNDIIQDTMKHLQEIRKLMINEWVMVECQDKIIESQDYKIKELGGDTEKLIDELQKNNENLFKLYNKNKV